MTFVSKAFNVDVKWRHCRCTTCRWGVRWLEVQRGVYRKVEERYT